MQSAVQTGELLTEIRVPATGPGVAYVKTAQKASGFALAGVAVVLDPDAKTARVAVNGVAPMAYRARALEAALEGRDWTPETLAQAAALAADEVEPMGDIHASPDYRAHLARINARRALTLAVSRAMT
jgi:CO/xanthine dehydrogenase FAD-binding subunit